MAVDVNQRERAELDISGEWRARKAVERTLMVCCHFSRASSRRFAEG